MIEYYFENKVWWVHLRVDHWTAGLRKQLIKEIRELAPQYNWPTVYCQVPPEKRRFMEHLGMKFVRNVWVTEGVISIYCLNTEVYKC